VIDANTLHAVETVQLAGGFSYDISGFSGANVGPALTVDAPGFHWRGDQARASTSPG